MGELLAALRAVRDGAISEGRVSEYDVYVTNTNGEVCNDRSTSALKPAGPYYLREIYPSKAAQDAHGKESEALAAFRTAKGVLADFKDPNRAVDIPRATVTEGEVVSEAAFLASVNKPAAKQSPVDDAACPEALLPLSPEAPAGPVTTWSSILQTTLCKKDEAVLRAEAEKVNAAADVSGDGGLSKTEMKKAIQKDAGLRAKLVSGSWKDFFAVLDKDGEPVEDTSSRVDICWWLQVMEQSIWPSSSRSTPKSCQQNDVSKYEQVFLRFDSIHIINTQKAFKINKLNLASLKHLWFVSR